MKKNIALLIFATLVTLIVGCHNGLIKDKPIEPKGKIVTRKLNVSGYSNLNIGKDFIVNVQKGESFKAEVTSNEDVLKYLDIYVNNETLYATYKEDVEIINPSITINIAIPAINSVNGRNDSIIEFRNNFDSEEFNLYLKNDSTFKASIKAINLNVLLTNDSIATINGTATFVNIKGESDTTSNLKDLKAEKATVALKSDAKCSIRVSDKVDITARSSASIDVYGKCKINKIDVGEDVVINHVTE